MAVKLKKAEMMESILGEMFGEVGGMGCCDFMAPGVMLEWRDAFDLKQRLMGAHTYIVGVCTLIAREGEPKGKGRWT